MSQTYTVAKLAEIVGGEVRGDGSIAITNVADLREASATDASWLSSPRFRKHMDTTTAGVVLIPTSMDVAAPCAIVCENIQRSIAKLLAAFAPQLIVAEPGVHPSAVVDATASLGEGVCVGPHVTIDAGATVGDRTELQAGVCVGENVAIGADCCLQQNVVIRHGCRLGDRVTILPNSVIGGDGFGFFYDEGAHQRIPHVGGVIIEDDVEIGACSCIDRAKFGHTVIGSGTKIDNLVQLAHNVHVGRSCVIVAQTGIAGSVRIGDGCVFAGRSGASDNITIGDGAQIAATSVPWADVPAGAKMAGTPAQDSTQEHRMQIHMRRLPALAAKLKKLIARVDKVEASADNQQ
jgi:UDP-3-O-[3-hydroxymyristoyl] glucosamine N-acyltransferase